MIKKSRVWLLVLCLIVSMLTVSVFASEALDTDAQVPASEYPNAEVTVMDPTVLTPEADEYYIYDGSLYKADKDLALQVVMNFKALDSFEAAQASRYGEWICDFYLTFEGADGTFSTKDCYLAGNYGSYGWIAIPAEALADELEYGVAYPVVSAYDPNLTYENICDYVKDFTAAIYVSPELLSNPDFKVNLELRMTNPENADDYMVIGEPAVYTANELICGIQKGEDIADLKGNTQVGGTVDTEANAEAIENAKNVLVETFPELTEEEIASATVELEVVFESLEFVEGKAPASYSYNVAPMLGVDDSRVKISTLDAPVTFRLPVHSAETKTVAKVYHNGTFMGTYDIKTENGEKFVEVASQSFSTFTVEPAAAYVAEVNGESFETLDDAITAAQSGDVIVLLSDINAVTARIRKDITLDLGGNTIYEAYINIYANVTVKNGSIINVSQSYPLVVEKGVLTIDDVDIEASASDRAIWVRAGELVFNSGSVLATKGVNNTTTNYIAAIHTAENTNVTINGGTITVDTPNNKAIAIYGNYEGANVTINDGKLSTSGANYSYGINVDGNITVHGGEIITNEKCYAGSSGVTNSYNHAIVTALGDVTITGGTITTNGPKGYIVSVGRSYNAVDQDIVIEGGEFTNVLTETDKAKGHATPCLIYEGSAANVTASVTNGSVSGFSSTLVSGNSVELVVSGGSFDVAIDEKYLQDGFELKQNADGTFGVEETVDEPAAAYVAEVNGVEYSSFEEALNASVAGDTIKIVKAGEYELVYKSYSEGRYWLPSDLTIEGVDGVVITNGPKFSATNITIKNVDFIVSSGSAVVFYLSGDCLFEDCYVSGPNGTTYSTVDRGTATFRNCTFKGTSTYGLHIGEGSGSVVVENSTLVGWNSYGNTGASTFTEVTFESNDTYGKFRPYMNVVLTGCTFDNKESYIDFGTSGMLVEFVDCETKDGSDLTTVIYAGDLKSGDYRVVVDDVMIAGGVAAIGDVQYATLADALAAANPGDEIVLLADVTLTSKLIITKAITINGNGHSIIADANVTWYTTSGKLQIKNYAPWVVLQADCTLKNLTIDSNNVAGGVKVENADVVFDNVSIIGTKADVLTVVGSLTVETYFKVEGAGVMVDARSGAIDAEPGTVFDITKWTGNVSPATSDLKGAVDVNGEPFFAAYGSTTYYKTLDSVTTSITNLTLLKDVELTKDIKLSGEINLGEYKITLPEGKSLILTSANSVLYGVEGLNVTTSVQGSKVVYDNGVYRVEAVKYVAEIDGTKYETLADAIAAAGAGDVIVLIDDIVLTETLVVPASAVVTLNLNGKTVSMEMSETVTKNHSMISNDGNLTIIGEGKLSYKYTGASLGTSYAANTVTTNPGSVLTVKGGTIENLTYDSAVIAYAIDGLTNGGIGDVIVNIEGGVITSLRQSIRIFANSTTKVGTLNISGGEIVGRVIVQNANSAANKAVLSITGGKITANEYKTEALYVGGNNGATIDINANVSGGTFIGEIASLVPNGFITGGIYSTAVPAEFCAEGYVPTENADGTYGVALDPAYGKVAKIGDTYYATLADAIAAAGAGDVIVLIDDVVLTETLVVPASAVVTLDLNGKTVSMVDASATTVALIKNNGTLTITDNSDAKDGKITFHSTTPSADNAYASNTIRNDGIIIIENGTIENTTVGGACYALDNYAGSTATINGGKLVAAKTCVRIFNWTNGDAAKTTLNINGGEIISEGGYGVNINAGNAPAIALNITGGTITTNDNVYALAVYVVNKGSAENLTIDVNGGTFNGYFALNGVTCTTMKKDAISISGGTFYGIVCYDTPVYGFVKGGIYSTAVPAEFCAEGYVPTENADGTYGVVEDTSVDPTVFIKYTNVVLTENFKISFAFAIDSVEDWTGYYVVINKISASDGTEKSIVIPVTEWAATTIDGERYIVVDYAGVAAKEMTDVLTVTVYNADGVAVSEEKNDSIKDYVMRKLNKSTDAQLCTLLVDMLNYGAAAQEFFGFATDKLANADLTEEQQAYASDAREYSDAAYGKTFADGYDFKVGNTLSLEYNIQLKVGFDLRELTLSDSAKIIVSYVNYSGKTISKEVSLADYAYKTEIVIVSCDTLTAHEQATQVKFELVDGDNKIVTFTNSVESFTARLGADSEKVDICNALMKYCDSAKAYFKK